MRVTLNESDHTYTDERGQAYKSVSSIIAQYKQPFDPYKIMGNGNTLIANYTEKNGFTEQYWIDNWAGKRDYACEKGHAFHSLKEMAINHSAVHKVEKKMMPVHNIGYEWNINRQWEGLFGLLPAGVYTELCMWNYRTRSAGTADKVIIFDNREFDLKDYKTNGEFKTEAFAGRCMKFPCTHLQDCHLGHYTLQLNLYAWMLKQFGLTPRNLVIEHYDIPDKDVAKVIKQGVLPDIEPTIHEVAYDDDMATLVMKERLNLINRYK